MFYARAGHLTPHSGLTAAQLVFALAAALNLLTLSLVGLLPRHSQQAHG
ncbi:hypothetical protein AB7952_12320 [Streptomyces sp. PG2]